MSRTDKNQRSSQRSSQPLPNSLPNPQRDNAQSATQLVEPGKSATQPTTRPTTSPDRSQPSPAQHLIADWRYIGSLFLVTRLALIAVGLAAYRIFPEGDYSKFGKPTILSSYPWLDMWGVWDSFWYLDIIQNGYSTASRIPELPGQTNFAFFPLYPLLVKGLGSLMGDRYFIAGLLISNICLLLSAYVLYRLVALERSPRFARRTVKYLFLFPVSFILSGLFTESLYLLLSLLCFYLARQQRWWLAGLCGGALSATRTLGVLIALPLSFDYLRSRRFNFKAIRWNVLFLALVPLGLIAFSIYSYRETGDFFFFKTNQADWGREVVNPVLSFWRAIVKTISEGSAKTLVEIVFCTAALGVLIRFYRALDFSYWLFGMYSILIPLSAGIASMPRFTIPIFPLYIGLAILGQNKLWNRAIVTTFIFLQAALMAFWCTGHGLVI